MFCPLLYLVQKLTFIIQNNTPDPLLGKACYDESKKWLKHERHIPCLFVVTTSKMSLSHFGLYIPKKDRQYVTHGSTNSFACHNMLLFYFPRSESLLIWIMKVNFWNWISWLKKHILWRNLLYVVGFFWVHNI